MSACLLEEVLAALPPLATTSEAAAALRMSRRTLARYIAAGRLRVIRVGDEGSARVLIPRIELGRFLSEGLA